VAVLRPFDVALTTARCLRLVTYRRNGSPVATPIWFVSDGLDLLGRTGAHTGKVHRIRANPQARVATCTYRGNPTSTDRTATVQLLDPATHGDRIEQLLRGKYGWQKQLVDALNAASRRIRRRPPVPDVYLRITLD
jgi:PPOX class probable F420-dependent enzyme